MDAAAHTGRIDRLRDPGGPDYLRDHICRRLGRLIVAPNGEQALNMVRALLDEPVEDQQDVAGNDRELLRRWMLPQNQATGHVETRMTIDNEDRSSTTRTIQNEYYDGRTVGTPRTGDRMPRIRTRGRGMGRLLRS